jgi:hypothetical protein
MKTCADCKAEECVQQGIDQSACEDFRASDEGVAAEVVAPTTEELLYADVVERLTYVENELHILSKFFWGIIAYIKNPVQ